MSDNEYIIRYRVNGTYLQKFIGKPVSIIGSIISVHPDGTSADIKTVENHIVTINMRRPIDQPLPGGGLVEFRGTGQSKSSIICDDYTVFPASFAENFDAVNHHEAMTLLHSVSNPWICF